jgi:CO/xanthine dehydrogenase Mo-binding subunit
MSDFVRKFSAFSAVKKRRKAIDQSNYPLRGIGLSLAFQGEDGSWEEIHESEETRRNWAMRLVLEKGRRLRIYTSFVDSAMGVHEMLVQRAAQLLEMDPQKVTVQPVDTREVPDTGPTIISKVVSFGFPLLEQCCAAIRRRRKEGVLPIEVRRSISAAPRLSTETGQPSRRRNRSAEGRSEPSWAATVVEVELDPVTFRSTCRGVWMVLEAGAVPARNSVLGVLEGEILRCLGWSRLPGAASLRAFPEGPCPAVNLIPSVTELPEIRVKLAEDGSAAMKGFENLPYLGVPAAYAAAVCQATGLYIDQLPITPEVIEQCLQT